MLKLEHISKTFNPGTVNEKKALSGLSLHLEPGDFVTIVGSNGAGKSTTLMTICGGTPPRSGEVLFRGHPIHTLRPNKIVALGISQVPEGRLIFPDLTVQENLDLGAFLRNDKDNIKKDLDYIFDLFPILAQRRAQTGGTLSGGEQQRVAIARALINRPEVLLADEPTGNLDSFNAHEIMHLLEEINQRGTTMIVVTHSHEMVQQMKKRVITMERGAVIQDEGGSR
mgnify:CR=1 FL=1